MRDVLVQQAVESGEQQINPADLRIALAQFASGITVITSSDDEGEIGFTCQSFYSVSLDPPLVSFSVMNTSKSYPRVRETGKFAVNVLSHGQADFAMKFAKSNTDKWSEIDPDFTRQGNPVLNDSVLWLDCEVWAEMPAGDHTIVLGRVTQMSHPSERKDEPLLFFQGKFHGLEQTTSQ